MKTATVIVIFLAMLAIAGALASGRITSFINAGTASLEGLDAQSLEGKALVPFALPGSNCKASFPGEPHIPSLAQALFPGGIQSGTSRVMADKKQIYYLCEINLPAMAVGLPDPGAMMSPLSMQQADINSYSVNTSMQGNNSVAASSNYTSEPLKIQDALQKFSKSWVADRGAMLESNVPAALKGGLFSGCQLSGKLKDGNERFRMRFYCNYPRKTMVVIGATGDGARVDSADTKHFLDSLDMW